MQQKISMSLNALRGIKNLQRVPKNQKNQRVKNLDQRKSQLKKERKQLLKNQRKIKKNSQPEPLLLPKKNLTKQLSTEILLLEWQELKKFTEKRWLVELILDSINTEVFQESDRIHRQQHHFFSLENIIFNTWFFI